MKGMREHLEEIGQTRYYWLNGMGFAVKIKDVRQRFGIIDYLVTPVNGDGEKWVEGHKLQNA